jgi:glycogen operon protein
MVLDCLRYWASEYHVDGFRFDLAAILGRDQNGAPLSNPPLLESLAYDPVLSKCKLVAEAWDAGGLYQVGSFPAYGRWAEWNGKYRDAVRRFIKSDPGLVSELAARIQGSPDLYWYRGPAASLNFITCHDGFTLRDLVSYNYKHNETNGEWNNDGCNDNYSWNCGHEGETNDPEVKALRYRQMKNAASLLFLSRGIPMLVMGDEVGRTQSGNNNAYCHDGIANWMDWDAVERASELLRFFSKLIAFRNAHPVLRSDRFFEHRDCVGSGKPDLAFHGTRVGQPDFGSDSRCLAFQLCGKHASPEDDDIYVAINAYWDALPFEVPTAPKGLEWRVAINTSMPSPDDIFDREGGPQVDSADVIVGGRSIMVLVAPQRP